MKFLTPVLVFAFLASCGPDDTGSREVIEVTSPEGRTFHFMPIIEDGVTDITVSVAWPTDWGFDAINNPTVPVVASEAILSGGTATMKPQELLALFNDANAGGYLTAGNDYVYGELGFPKEHTDKVVSVAAEMLANPQFDPAWIARIADGVKANQDQNNALSSTQMWSALRVAMFGDAPILRALNGSDTNAITDVNRDLAMAWHRATLTQDTAALVVTGAINADDAGKVVDTLLSGLPKEPGATVGVAAPDFTQRTILLHLPEAEKTTLGLVGQLPATREGGDLIDLLALQVFSGGNGPLFDAIRTELRASYGLQAGYANFDRTNRLLFITGEVDTEKLAEARDVVLQTYGNFLADPDLGALDGVRASLADGTQENVGYVDVAANTIRELAMDGQDVTLAPKLGDAVREITAGQIKTRLAAAFPAADALMVVAVSPDASALPGACVITQFAQAANCP